MTEKGSYRLRFTVAKGARGIAKRWITSSGRADSMKIRHLLAVLSLGLSACGHPKLSGLVDAGENPVLPPGAQGQADASTSEIAAPVGLDGVFAGSPTPADVISPRIYSKSFKTWVFSEPRPDAQRLGYLRLGSSVAIRTEVAGKVGCSRGWYALADRGFMCLDDTATLDAKDPIVLAMNGAAPNLSRKLPFIYGTVRRPGPVYRRIPTVSEAAREEPDFATRYLRWLTAPGENGAAYGQQVWLAEGAPAPDPAEAWQNKQSDLLPEFLRNGKALPKIPGEPVTTAAGLVSDAMAPRLGYSILRTFLVDGRRYGLTSRFEVVPTDRLRPIQGSDFHGFRVPQDIDFPFAIVRQPGAMLYEYESDTKKLRAKEHATYRSALKLTGKQAFFRGRLHFETDGGAWVSDRDASRLDPVKKMPAWGTNGEKWIDINVTKQTLALYEGTKAVYATLVSTGEAGLSDPDKSTATKRGIYRIHTKHISATMDSDVVGEEFELRDVPYVQYFESNYALHGAYWHDRFGIPKSHGCINLAPEDARRIFSWTEPRVPDGWHGALLPLRGTVLFVHP